MLERPLFLCSFGLSTRTHRACHVDAFVVTARSVSRCAPQSVQQTPLRKCPWRAPPPWCRPGAADGRRTHDLSGAEAEADDEDDDDDNDDENGELLQRPPPGWDDLAGGAQGRWAWGTEPLTDLEQSLLPRKALKGRVCYTAPRLALLLILAWGTVFTLSISAIIAPLLVGRRAFSLLHVPRPFAHDPFAFAAGVALLTVLKPVIEVETTTPRTYTLVPDGRHSFTVTLNSGLRCCPCHTSCGHPCESRGK